MTGRSPAVEVGNVRGRSDRWSRRIGRAVHELDAVDRAVYRAIAETPTPTLDGPLRRLSDAADFSKPWLAVAVGMAAAGGPRGRRAALSGVAAIAVTSAAVNQGLKRLYPRPRPDREGEAVPTTRHVEMPTSTSFPSGHSASGFAFASAVAPEFPVAGGMLRFLAAAVAYSRVHTGVHYPGDAVVGSVIGGAIGGAAAGARHWLA